MGNVKFSKVVRAECMQSLLLTLATRHQFIGRVEQKDIAPNE